MLDFNRIETVSKPKVDREKKEVKVKRNEKINKRIGEPGIKIPIADYKQIGQHCDNCDDVYTHLLNLETNEIMCNNCGKIKKVGTRKVEKLENLVINKIEFFSLFDLVIKF